MAKRSGPWYGRDLGLSFRMSLTMFLLFALYAAFVVVLVAVRVPIPMLVFILVLVAASQYFLSDQLVLWSTGSRMLGPHDAPELRRIVERVAQLADLPMPKLAYMRQRMPNAFTIGKNPKKSVITVTQGLLDLLDEHELEAVIAHEMTHIKNRDVVVISLASFFAMVASFIVQQFFFFGMGMEGERRDRQGGGGQAVIIVWLASLAVWAISYVLIRTLSRYREYAADRGSAILTGHPAYLASALQKIQAGMRQTPTRDLRHAEAFNAFYVFPAMRKGSFRELFATHPTLEHRVAYLEKLQQIIDK